MINQMDALVEGGRGDEQYMQLFKDTYVPVCYYIFCVWNVYVYDIVKFVCIQVVFSLY